MSHTDQTPLTVERAEKPKTPEETEAAIAALLCAFEALLRFTPAAPDFTCARFYY